MSPPSGQCSQCKEDGSQNGRLCVSTECSHFLSATQTGVSDLILLSPFILSFAISLAFIFCKVKVTLLACVKCSPVLHGSVCACVSHNFLSTLKSRGLHDLCTCCQTHCVSVGLVFAGCRSVSPPKCLHAWHPFPLPLSPFPPSVKCCSFPTAPLVCGYWYSVTRLVWLPPPCCSCCIALYTLPLDLRLRPDVWKPSHCFILFRTHSDPALSLHPEAVGVSSWGSPHLVSPSGCIGQLCNLQIGLNRKHIWKNNFEKYVKLCLQG